MFRLAQYLVKKDTDSVDLEFAKKLFDDIKCSAFDDRTYDELNVLNYDEELCDIYKSLYESDHFRTPEFYSSREQLQLAIEQIDIPFIKDLFCKHPELFIKKNNGIVLKTNDVIILLGYLLIEDNNDTKLLDHITKFIYESENSEAKNLISKVVLLTKKDVELSFILTYLWNNSALPSYDIDNQIEFFMLFFEKKPELYKQIFTLFINDFLENNEVKSQKILCTPGTLFLEKIATKEDASLALTLLDLGVPCNDTVKTKFFLIGLENNIINPSGKFLSKQLKYLIRYDDVRKLLPINLLINFTMRNQELIKDEQGLLYDIKQAFIYLGNERKIYFAKHYNKINDIIVCFHQLNIMDGIYDIIYSIIQQKNIQLSQEACRNFLIESLHQTDIANWSKDFEEITKLKSIISTLGEVFFNEKMESVADLKLAIDLIKNGVEISEEKLIQLLDFSVRENIKDNTIFSFLNSKIPLIYMDGKNEEQINIYTVKQALSMGSERYKQIDHILEKLKNNKYFKDKKSEISYSLSMIELLKNGEKSWEKFRSAMQDKKKQYPLTLPFMLEEALSYYSLIHARLRSFDKDWNNEKKQNEIKLLLKSEYGLQALGFLGVTLGKKELANDIMVENALQRIFNRNNYSFFSEFVQGNDEQKSNYKIDNGLN